MQSLSHARSAVDSFSSSFGFGLGDERHNAREILMPGLFMRRAQTASEFMRQNLYRTCITIK